MRISWSYSIGRVLMESVEGVYGTGSHGSWKGTHPSATCWWRALKCSEPSCSLTSEQIHWQCLGGLVERAEGRER